MRNAVNSGAIPSTALLACSARGEARFERFDATTAELELDYHVSGLEAALADDSDAALAEGVAAVCRQEVAFMRATLLELGQELTEQLSEVGKTPVADQTTKESDERTWLDRRSAIHIAPTSFHSELRLSGYEGVADAKLVRGTIEIAIAHREVSIRKVYQQILEDATARREAMARHRPDHAPSRPNTPAPLGRHTRLDRVPQ
jgi:hypothetical protein